MAHPKFKFISMEDKPVPEIDEYHRRLCIKKLNDIDEELLTGVDADGPDAQESGDTLNAESGHLLSLLMTKRRIAMRAGGFRTSDQVLFVLCFLVYVFINCHLYHIWEKSYG